MARKGWNQLSADYRARLQRGGIDQTSYASGASLRAARGHEQTPEKPGQGLKQFPKYYQTRAQLMNQVIQRKEDLFGGRERFDSEHSKENVLSSNPSITHLRWALRASEEDLINALVTESETYWFLGYI